MEEQQYWNNEIKNRVTNKLKSKMGISEEQATKMVLESTFHEMLLEDPECVNRYNIEYWVRNILKENKLL